MCFRFGFGEKLQSRRLTTCSGFLRLQERPCREGSEGMPWAKPLDDAQRNDQICWVSTENVQCQGLQTARIRSAWLKAY
jgi:hypothetical protein